jgi:uncharacterized protein (DUF1800 family)
MKTVKKICIFFLLAPLILYADIPKQPTDAQIYHLLARTTNGITSQDFTYVKEVGIARYLEEQLYIKSTTEFKPYENHVSWVSPQENRKEYRKLRQQYLLNAKRDKLSRSLYTKAQFADIMHTFWFNHFNVFAQKGSIPFLIASYEQEAIMPFALGNFRDLLGAVAKHPAMLIYLDNQKSIKANVKKNKGINENFARELMELHTLGVGNYTQNDIKELARILTGWGVVKNKFAFNKKMHDQDPKFFLGVAFGAMGGVEEGEKALDMLAFSKHTANFLAYKLCQYFVSDTPPRELVNEVAETFYATKGDIKKTLLKIFYSDIFWQEENQQNKYKDPYRYVVSLVRASGIKVTDHKPIIGLLKQMGMPIYGRLTPDGYPVDSKKYLSPSAIESRLQFATNLGRNNLDICENRCKINLLDLSFIELTPKIQKTLETTPKRLHTALLLGTPQMMRY